MQTVNEAGDVQASETVRELDHLMVELTAGELLFSRTVYPVGDATVAEVIAAMRDDSDFLNPLVEKGLLEVVRGRKRIVLARYSTDMVDGWIEGDIDTVTACYDDDTSEELPE